MKKLLKSKVFYVALALLFLLAIYDFYMAKKATLSAVNQFWLMLQIVPPIFVLIGLLDVFVPRETMIRLMGDKSKHIGVFIAFFFGTLAAGPLVAAFPLAMIMLKKGAKFANVMFFMMIFASAKLPILVFQIEMLGLKYTLVSNGTLIIIFLIGSFVIEALLGEKEINSIREKANNY